MGKPVALDARAEEREVRGIDLDDHHAARLRVMGELDVGAADDLDGLDDIV